MKKQSLVISIGLTCLAATSLATYAMPRPGNTVPQLGPCGQQPTDQVTIPDQNLLAVIDGKLGLAAGTPVTRAQMQTLTALEADGDRIENLQGLQCATNLKVLGLHGDPIHDISPLSALDQLENFTITDAQVSNLWPLSNLTSLKRLQLDDDGISDLRPLSGLTALTDLSLARNQIRDLSPLAPLVNLQNLYIVDQQGIESQTPDLSGTVSVVSRKSPTAVKASTSIAGTDFVMPTPEQNRALSINLPGLDKDGNAVWPNLTPDKTQTLLVSVSAQVKVGQTTAFYRADAYYSVKWVP